MKDKKLLLGIAGLLFLSLVLMPVTTVFAGARPLDVSVQEALNPPPPDWYTCYATGSGTVCHGKMTFEHFEGYDGTCPQGFDILENGYKEETGARYYDRNGDLIKRVLHDIYPVGDPRNILYNSQTGKSIPYTTDGTETDTFAVPGDFNSLTARFTGNLYTVTLPGGGLLVHDVGVFTFGPDGSILEDRGPKMLFFGETEKLCAALE
jgi:hypothetical protein